MKHTVNGRIIGRKYGCECNAVASYLGFENFGRSLQGQCFIFGALCPSKSGPMNKHIVKHITSMWISRPVVGLAGTMFHFWCPIPVLVRTNNEQTYRETYRERKACALNIEPCTDGRRYRVFLVPYSRLSPD